MTLDTDSPPAASTILRRRLESGQFTLAPGVYDGLSARIALEVGFDALYMVDTRQTPVQLTTDTRLTRRNPDKRQEPARQLPCTARQT